MFGVRKAYRELVKSVREMQQENDQLKAENARLRSELESVGTAAYLYGRGNLLAENAKLREDLEDQEGYDQILRDRLRQQTELCVKAEAENAKLRDSLKALMIGTNVELCADRDASQCQECSMALDEHRCATSDAMLLLGIDMYGEPLGRE